MVVLIFLNIKKYNSTTLSYTTQLSLCGATAESHRQYELRTSEGVLSVVCV